MAIDWGIALGSAVNSGVDKYTTLQEQAARDLQAQRLKKQMDEEEGLRRANQEVEASQYEGGTELPALTRQALPFYDEKQQGQLNGALAQMTPEQQQTALRSFSPVADGHDLSKIGVYRSPEGKTLATNDYTPLDPSKRQLAVMDRMAKEGNLYGLERSMGLYTNMREVEIKRQYDEYREGTINMQKELTLAITKHGIAAAPDIINKQLKDTDYSVKFVDSKNGPGAVVLYEKGKPTERFTNMDSIVKAASTARLQQFAQNAANYFSNPADFASYVAKQQELELSSRKVAAEEKNVASMAGYRNQMVNLQQAQFEHTKETSQRDYRLKRDIFDSDNSVRDVTGPPVGTVNGIPVYKNPRGVGLIDGGGNAIPADATFEQNVVPSAAVQQVKELAKSMVASGEINSKTGKEFTLPEAEVEASNRLKKQGFEQRRQEVALEVMKNTDLKPNTPQFNAAVNALMSGGPTETITSKAVGGMKDGDLSAAGQNGGGQPAGQKSAIPTPPSIQNSLWNARNADRSDNRGPRSIYGDEALADRVGQVYQEVRDLEAQKTQLELAAKRKGLSAADRKEYNRQIDAVNAKLRQMNSALMQYTPRPGALHRNAPTNQR
jgi:hypothetical protein